MKDHSVFYKIALRRRLTGDFMSARIPVVASAQAFPEIVMGAGWREGYHPGLDADVDFSKSLPILNAGGMGNQPFCEAFRRANHARFTISLDSRIPRALVDGVFLRNGKEVVYRFRVAFENDGRPRLMPTPEKSPTKKVKSQVSA